MVNWQQIGQSILYGVPLTLFYWEALKNPVAKPYADRSQITVTHWASYGRACPRSDLYCSRTSYTCDRSLIKTLLSMVYMYSPCV